MFGDQAEGERAFSGPVVDGDNEIIIDVPLGTVASVNYRARLYDSAGAPERDAASFGGAQGGEVEDKDVTLGCGAWLELTPASAAQVGDPGTDVTYDLTVTNVGNCVDSFDVATSGNLWATIAPAVIGPMEPAEVFTFQVTVSIPAGANAGDSDQATITLTSQADSSVEASSVLTTSVTGAASNRFYIPLIMR
jgi:hypothetical protein